KAKSTFSGDVEVFISSHSSLEIHILDGEIEVLDSYKESGIGIRVLDQGKLGFAYHAGLGLEGAAQCLQQAIENSRCTSANPYLNFSGAKLPKTKLDLFDPQISATPLQKKIDMAKNIEKIARAHDQRILKTEKVIYNDSEAEAWLQTSTGFCGSLKTNHASAMAMVVAGDGQTFESGTGFLAVKKIKDLDAEKVGKEAAEKAVEMLGARTTQSRKTTLVFEPKIAAQILSLLISPLSGEAVMKGKSLFHDKVGKIVAAKILNVIDDGTMPNGLATSPFDGEGIPCQKTVLIKNGVLRGFLHNIYSANKTKHKPTGNSGRGSYQGLPGLSSTNFYIENGKTAPEKLIQQIKDGIYIARIMGFHTADPISGDFSFGVQGLLIENGKKTYPVRGITIAGNMIELLQSISALGNDLQFDSTLGSPTLVVEDISVGGA
ncbi:MAG: TldD/PmbA family protein, partial [Candidatus Margulisiibacteriota bacterium]